MAGVRTSFTPVPGCLGIITINGTTRNLDTFTPSISSPAIDVTNFNSPTDANGLVHEEFVQSVVGSQFDISGPRDASAQGYNPQVGDSGTGFLGYSTTFGFSFSFGVISMGGPQAVKDTGRFQATIKVTGLLTYVGP